MAKDDNDGLVPYDGDLNKLDGPPANPKLRHAFRQAMLLSNGNMRIFWSNPLVGSIVTAGAGYNPLSTWLGLIAVVCATTNVVGGFVITDRMLKMFKRKDIAKKE